MHPDLSEFLAEHAELERRFRAHQAALMALDLDSAEERLARFAELLADHARVEEELLLPVYAGLARESRFGPDMIRDDHEKLARGLAALRVGLGELRERPELAHEDVIDLLDRELVLKRLLHHHDDRERAGLFPALDALPREELDALMARVAERRAARRPV